MRDLYVINVLPGVGGLVIFLPSSPSPCPSPPFFPAPDKDGVSSFLEKCSFIFVFFSFKNAKRDDGKRFAKIIRAQGILVR